MADERQAAWRFQWRELLAAIAHDLVEPLARRLRR